MLLLVRHAASASWRAEEGSQLCQLCHSWTILHLLLQAYHKRFMEGWTGLAAVHKPIIAAVNGYALGGGCEVAMMADIIIASSNAVFGQVRHPTAVFRLPKGCSGCLEHDRASRSATL